MTLISSVSGIRGTLGGKEQEGLTPLDIVKFTAAYVGVMVGESKSRLFLLGRDGRSSGEWISEIVRSTVRSLGYEVMDIAYVTTPTIEMAVRKEKACGGIIVTASHNPVEWNALKLLNSEGEFIKEQQGKEVERRAITADFEFSPVQNIGQLVEKKDFLQYHIDEILALPTVNVDVIRGRKLKVVLDPINSVGTLAIPPLLEKLGVAQVEIVFGDINKDFEHNPEPLEHNLSGLRSKVQELGFDLGISVDPDCDRLCFVCEDGTMFGEEYTLAVVVDWILQHQKGSVVSNLSSSRVVRDIAHKHECSYFASKVGELNVVEKMKENNAVIGGEGNGGVILPALHCGRDALVGIALFLSRFVKENTTLSEFKKMFPSYYMFKDKVELSKDLKWDDIIKKLSETFSGEEVNTSDGIKIDFAESWVHLRKSNTEPIVRIYSEAKTAEEAEQLNQKIKSQFFNI